MPGRVRRAVAETRAVLDEVQADVVVGFGGYVALPAYLAARRARIPVVVHEQNALPGLANRVGARIAARVAVTVPGTPLHRGEHVGMPLRTAISSLDRSARRAEARAEFGLDADRPTLLVFGGSQGAASLNRAAVAAADALTAAGVQVLHARGPKNTEVSVPVRPAGQAPYVVVDYLERMDLAYAAADLALCRAGAVTVAELSAVGLPAAFVPLPIGNGEQRRNALPGRRGRRGPAGRGRRVLGRLDRGTRGAAAHRSGRPGRVRAARRGGRGAGRRRTARRDRGGGGA